MNLSPGIYKATVRGVSDQIIKVVSPETYGATCTVHTPEGKCVCHEIGNVTDARPLILLDLGAAISALRIATLLRDHGHGGVADQIEAQTKPARSRDGIEL